MFPPKTKLILAEDMTSIRETIFAGVAYHLVKPFKAPELGAPHE